MSNGLGTRRRVSGPDISIQLECHAQRLQWPTSEAMEMFPRMGAELRASPHRQDRLRQACPGTDQMNHTIRTVRVDYGINHVRHWETIVFDPLSEASPINWSR